MTKRRTAIFTVHLLSSEENPHVDPARIRLKELGFHVTTDDDEVLFSTEQFPCDALVLVAPCDDVELVRFGASVGARQLTLVLNPSAHGTDEDGREFSHETHRNGCAAIGLRELGKLTYFTSVESLASALGDISRAPRVGDVWARYDATIELMSHFALFGDSKWVVRRTDRGDEPVIISEDYLVEHFTFDRCRKEEKDYEEEDHARVHDGSSRVDPFGV